MELAIWPYSDMHACYIQFMTIPEFFRHFHNSWRKFNFKIINKFPHHSYIFVVHENNTTVLGGLLGIREEPSLCRKCSQGTLVASIQSTLRRYFFPLTIWY